MSKIKHHPLADLFPTMTPEEISRLASDIKTNGQLEPIVIHEGKILDGRNRYTVCYHELKIEPKFVDFDGTDPVAFVLSKNLHRRHLSESQRAMVAGRLATLEQGRPKKGSIDPFFIGDAAQLLNVSAGSVKRARQVLETGNENLIRAVEKGRVSVNKAATIAKDPEHINERLQETWEPKPKRAKKQWSIEAAFRSIDSVGKEALAATETEIDLVVEFMKRWIARLEESRR